MLGKEPRLNPLELRKQLLIAESELNRARLSAEWQSLKHGVLDLSHRAKTLAAWASSAALVVAGITALRRGLTAPRVAKPSWFQRILSGARLASTIWLAFHARRAREEHKSGGFGRIAGSDAL